MKNREHHPTGTRRGSRRAEPDPVAAFWLNMARTARTEGLRRLHTHLACQRVDFLANRLRMEREQAAV
jgi:hypothetical protein